MNLFHVILSSYNDDVSELLAGGAIVTIILIALAISFLCVVIAYFLTAFPLYKLAKNSGYSNAFLAWIPYANIYLEFDLPSNKPFSMFGERIKLEKRSVAFCIYLGIILGLGIILSIFSSVLSVIPVIGVFLGLIIRFIPTIAAKIMLYYMYYDIIEMYSDDDSTTTVWAIFSALFPIVFIIWLWINMNKVPNSKTITATY